VIDGSRNADDRKTEFAGKDFRAAERAVASDHNERVNFPCLEIIECLAAAFGSFELHAPRRFQNGTATLDNIAHRMRRQGNELIINEPLVTLHYAHHLELVIDTRADHGTYAGVHAGRVSSRREHPNLMYTFLH